MAGSVSDTTGGPREPISAPILLLFHDGSDCVMLMLCQCHVDDVAMLLCVMSLWHMLWDVMLRYAMICYAVLYCVVLCYVMACYVMLCYVMSCHFMPCHVMSCHVMSCHVVSCRFVSCLNVQRGAVAKRR